MEIIIFFIQFIISICSSNDFQQCGQLSVYVSTIPGTICDAWSKCYSMGARLVVEEDIPTIIICNVLTVNVNYFIGLYDVLNERFMNKTGWIFSDGSELKNINYWLTGQPNNAGGSQDCVVIVDKMINDMQCQTPYQYICVIPATFVIHANIFTHNSTRPIFNNDAETGCYDSISTRNKLHCATKTLTNPYYKSFYFESTERLCVLTKYVDSTLPASYNTTNRNWIRFQRFSFCFDLLDAAQNNCVSYFNI